MEVMTPDSLDPQLLTLLARPYFAGQCLQLLKRLIAELDWQDSYYALGRRFEVPRVQAWYADPGVHYRYSDNMLEHRDWIEPLVTIKHDVERLSGHSFNSVLVTWYRDGSDHVTWHADDEAELGESPVIASLSLGARRHFEYKPKSGGTTRSLALHAGDLLLMLPAFQNQWLHAVPREPGVTMPRINLTFRRVHMARE